MLEEIQFDNFHKNKMDKNHQSLNYVSNPILKDYTNPKPTKSFRFNDEFQVKYQIRSCHFLFSQTTAVREVPSCCG